jgi:glycerol-3-phosphate acyltransferase PlsY
VNLDVNVMEEIAVVACGYLVGSLPFSFWLAKWRGVDVRRAGSGNVGAANVLRTSGAATATAAVLLDVAKGAVAVMVALRFASGPIAPVAAGLASMVGHIHPIWLKGRGGKGVATAAGVFLVVEPLAVTAAAMAFAVGVLSTHYVSVGSIAGAVTLAAAVVILGAPSAVVVGAVTAALIVVLRHRDNLGRLFAGTERRVWERS